MLRAEWDEAMFESDFFRVMLFGDEWGLGFHNRLLIRNKLFECWRGVGDGRKLIS